MAKIIKRERRTRVVPIKVTDSEYEEIKKKANKFTQGVTSEWIRYAAINLDPKRKHLVEAENE